ncbi:MULTISPECIES: conjugative transposon protein TraM [unclassified Flavobacterium]|uniref:conjugative transposon protein TraM n=1 Tax=unclassified Flavobacterium TaxID=196869 RepID=UPI0013D5A6FE|nr:MULTISPECIES: conjugative transposon protein TraM [unclassified Flavobacterium]MBA5793924.1 conjugative transposon protein TraM [Flavobacterium sp. xlx-221]
MNWDFKSLSEEDKRKYIVYTIFGIISIGVIGIGFSFVGGEDSSNKEVSTMDIPLSSEKEQYETRLQALKKFDTVKADPNQRMTQFFARKKEDDIEGNIDYFNQNKSETNFNTSYEPIHQQVDNTTPVRKSNYNRYGNPSMWQVEEPQNSNIGYSSANNYVENRVQQIEQRTTVQTTETYMKNVVSVEQSKKEIFENGKQVGNGTIQAVVRGTQEVKNGQTLRFQTNADGFIGGVKIPRNTSLFGIVRFNQYRAEITIETANINGSIVPVNLVVYSNDGLKGIPISLDESLKQGRNSAVDDVARSGGILGKAGSVVGSVVSNKVKEPSVKFIDNQKVLLIQK